jgi:superfamily II RNA helicase
MVKVCSLEYPNENKDEMNEYFDMFNHPLHDFQKWSIDATVNGHHVLACAPTGSGKSLCAEFAIDFFYKIGKKSIYCSPIKSLSNQKFYDFTRKFPHMSIGLITGDIKLNSTADVLIMTTEILLNQLYSFNKQSGKGLAQTPMDQHSTNLAPPFVKVDFEMDIANELGCVIFDEIHMIGDKDRGHVWENSIMMLPRHIQMIGLSATLDNPEKFAFWLETRGDLETVSDKTVYLTKKLVRPVPLTHYSFITVNSNIFKSIKDKTVHEEIKRVIDKPFILQDANGVFNEQTYLNTNKMLKLFETNEVRVKRTHVLNQLSKHLVENEMLPALCFVFSIKQLEKCANEITYPLLEFDSKIPYTIDRECEQIIRKLPNYQEYLLLPEYVKLVALLQKGVAIHHSKMMPVLREIVEILFSKGMIKMLFCTTSVAIGLNLPVKTSIFTDIYKHNGEHITILQGNEYVQAAGRAGRLGIDTVGHVIHLNNLFTKTDIVSYKTMMKGAPQKLASNFKISYNLLLNMINGGETDYCGIAKKSMIQDEINNQLKHLQNDTNKIVIELDRFNTSIQHMKTPINVIEEYTDLKKRLPLSVNKKRKDIERAIQRIDDDNRDIKKDIESYKKYGDKKAEKEELTNKIYNTEKTLDNNVKTVLYMLETGGFIKRSEEEEELKQEIVQIKYYNPNNTSYYLLLKGQVATHLREVHCLVFADLIILGKLNCFLAKEIVAFLSCFTNVKVCDNLKAITPIFRDTYIDPELKQLIINVAKTYETHSNLELLNRVDTGTDYSIQFDLVEYMINWCDCETDVECKLLLQKLSEEKEVFLGEFVKAVLKIANIAAEMEAVAELLGNVELLQKLREVPGLLLKFVATNQSLYV